MHLEGVKFLMNLEVLNSKPYTLRPDAFRWDPKS